MNADPRDDANKPTPPTEGRGIEKLGQKGRLEYRMVKDGQDATPDVIAQTIDDLKAWREDNHHDGRPPAWSRIADNIGIPSTTLSEVIAGKYKGNIQPAIVKIDQFLADARARRGRFEFRTTARIGITEAIFGALRTGIRLNTMPVIIGSPGTGKSAHMRAFMTDRPGVIMIRIDEATCHSRGVTKLLCQAIPELRNNTFRTAGKRMDAIKEWLRKHGSTVIIVDEAQKLDRSGLEMLRDIHDVSDPTTRRNVPIVFVGDHDFLKLIFAARHGGRSPISPQCIRRMRPVLDINADCKLPDGGLYTTGDILKIVENHRVQLLTPRAARWVRDLANVIEYGALGNAIGVLQLAIDLAAPVGGNLENLIDVDTLQEALEMTFGQSVAVQIDEQTDGALLRRATA